MWSLVLSGYEIHANMFRTFSIHQFGHIFEFNQNVMVVYVFRVTRFTIECIRDGSGLAVGVPFGAFPIDIAAVHIVPDVLVAHVM